MKMFDKRSNLSCKNKVSCFEYFADLSALHERHDRMCLGIILQNSRIVVKEKTLEN